MLHFPLISQQSFHFRSLPLLQSIFIYPCTHVFNTSILIFINMFSLSLSGIVTSSASALSTSCILSERFRLSDTVTGTVAPAFRYTGISSVGASTCFVFPPFDFFLHYKVHTMFLSEKPHHLNMPVLPILGSPKNHHRINR